MQRHDAITQAKAGRASIVIKAWWLVLVVGVVSVVLLSWLSRSSTEPLALQFLYYTNNAVRARIALMEITNRAELPYEWHLRSEAKGVNSCVWVTDLVETNGELRAVGISGGINLFEHDALQFGTDDFQPGKRLWVAIKHYPQTRWEQ